MKKTALFALATIFCLTAFAQKDSTKKDTVKVPVILLEKTDTSVVTVLCVRKNKAEIADVYVLARGYKNSENKWVQQPVVRILDKRYRPFTNKIIQVIQ
jgi:hypothetical protein